MKMSATRYAEVVRFDFTRLLTPQRSPKLPVIAAVQKGVIRAPARLVNLESAWARLPTSRKVDNVRSDKMISDIFSHKMHAHIRCESTLERDAALLLDWAPAVATFRSQPKRLDYEIDGKMRFTTPDFEVQIYGGQRPGLIEVKPERKAVTFEHVVKSQAVSYAATMLDIHYGYLTCSEIRLQPRLNNVMRLRKYASTPVSSDLLALVAEASWHWTRLGTLRKRASAQKHNAASIFALMYWGVLHFDIQEPLNDSLVVRFGGQRHA